MFQCFQQYFNTLALLDIGRVCQTLYTDIMMQMQNALEKLVLGLVFELDDRLELKCWFWVAATDLKINWIRSFRFCEIKAKWLKSHLVSF